MEFIKKYIGLIVGAVVVVVYLVGFKFPIDHKDLEAFDLVNVHLGLSKYLVYLLTLLCLGFFVYKVIEEPKKAIKLGVSIGVLGFLFLFNYLKSSADISEVANLNGITILPNEYQFLGGLISTTIGLIAIGVLVLAGFTIKKMIQDAKA